MGELAFIGMGSNLGDRAATIGAAIDALDAAEGVAVLRSSMLHETPPVGGPSGQGPYLNAALKVETTLPPRDLLGVLQTIERDSGRVRAARWSARTLDLDLLLYGNSAIDEPGLSVPHPRMMVRRFVLAPLAEVSAEPIAPLRGRPICSLLFDLDRRPGGVVLCGPDPDDSIAARVVEGLDALDLRYGSAGWNIDHLEGGRWIVHSRSSLRSMWAIRSDVRLLPNFSATWGPESEESPAASQMARLGRHGEIGLGGQLLRIRAPEGGEATRDWIVAEILAACASSRVPTRVVGSP
ncbi:MAG TPA: 2-amino-4-hydroxy-6-hydroxymethyldihydropteridine diphosphokinase [Isosphaeraceae bacterium]|jgi:2-amino-4-hydroxy-6-hydroxymethyldihydropteridine diphosphokinase|nr:2-amino-4-hydroxy-6-hydroxymethyldihydropteridine diphosphokinase [Isosphaeraceae bacterium]